MPLPQAPDPSTRRATHRRGKRTSVHPLIVGARRQFDDVRNSYNDYLRPRSRRLPDIYVSKATVDCALEFANALYLALEDRGYRVVFAPGNRPYSRSAVDERLEGGKGRDPYRSEYGVWVPDSVTVVFIGSVAIGLTIFEVSEKTEMRWTAKGHVRGSELPKLSRWEAERSHARSYTTDKASGRLCLRASSARSKRLPARCPCCCGSGGQCRAPTERIEENSAARLSPEWSGSPLGRMRGQNAPPTAFFKAVIVDTRLTRRAVTGATAKTQRF